MAVDITTNLMMSKRTESETLTIDIHHSDPSTNGCRLGGHLPLHGQEVIRIIRLGRADTP